MYSPDTFEIVAEVISVACITALSLFFGRKIASIDGPVCYSQALLLTLYSLSWAFDLIACMLTSTNNGNYISCVLGYFNIVLIYTATKIALYLYFIERIYILSVPRTTRLRSPLYILHLVLLLPFAALIVLMIIFRVTLVSEQFPYHCTIGMQMPASTAVLAYGILINLIYSAVFAKLCFLPNTAQRSVQQSSCLRIMAKRNLITAVVSLVVTTINYALLISWNGEERGLVAMMIASLDITFVAGAIHWSTAHPADTQCSEKALQGPNGEKPVKLEIKQHQEVVVLTELASHQ